MNMAGATHRTERTVLIIGSGIAGASTAWHLADRGWSVTIVDDQRDGGATLAGAGIATPFTLDDQGPDWAWLMFAASQYYLDLVPRLVRPTEASRAAGHAVVGEMIIARDDHEAGQLPAAARRIAAATQQWGDRSIGSTELLSGDDAAHRHPLLAPVAAALWLPLVAQVNGDLLRQRLLAGAQARGARHLAAPAELRRTEAGAVSALVDGEPTRPDEIVVAAGAWTDKLLAPVGLMAGVYPQRGQLVHARIEQAVELPVITGFGSNYLLTFDGGRSVFGPTREDSSGFDQWPTIEGVHLMIADALELAPGLRTARWIETRSGLRPASRDGHPTIGRLTENLSVVTGFGAQGLTVGGYAGRLVADGLDSGEFAVPETFRPQRWSNPV
jgi:D-amino-acid dehydrogenase